MEIIARRQFDPVYIWLDIGFLLAFAAILLWRKKYMATVVGVLAGLLYLAVDYGIFHLACGAREISQGHSMFWVLFWMSMSYGFTNFVWIWLWISKDRDLVEWSFLILLWWFCCPLLAQTFGGAAEPIVIQRTTGAYHGAMAVILFVGYFLLILWNLAHRRQEERAPVLWLLAIGILVQFGWEAALLLGGVRSAGFAALSDKLRPLIVNSLLETNLGMPYIYGLYLLYSARFTETMQKRGNPVTFLEAMRENNRRRVRHGAAEPPAGQL